MHTFIVSGNKWATKEGGISESFKGIVIARLKNSGCTKGSKIVEEKEIKNDNYVSARTY